MSPTTHKTVMTNATGSNVTISTLTPPKKRPAAMTACPASFVDGAIRRKSSRSPRAKVAATPTMITADTRDVGSTTMRATRIARAMAAPPRSGVGRVCQRSARGATTNPNRRATIPNAGVAMAESTATAAVSATNASISETVPFFPSDDAGRSSGL